MNKPSVFPLLLLVGAFALDACNDPALSGYDARRYPSGGPKTRATSSAEVDQETMPLPRLRPAKMLDPRSPLDAGP